MAHRSTRGCRPSGLPAFVLAFSLLAHAQEAREITISGCLLSSGYAGFQVEEAVLDAIDGKPADDKTKAAAPMKWILDGGGNLRRRAGEKVQVVGKTEWRADDKDQAPGTPHLEVTTVTTLAASCKS
jgi:hypothetical protein